MHLFRTPATEEEYRKYISQGGMGGSCPLCEKESLKEFKLWRIVENQFPYDKIASTHHMILPARHVTEEGLSEGELAEYKEVKKEYLHRKYEFLIEATFLTKSVPGHFHIHLLIGKK